MKLGELFERLSYGELSNLSISESGSGVITPGKEPKVITAVNQAVRAIFSRVSQKRSYLTVQLSPSRQRYTLEGVHRVSDTNVLNLAPRYILDTVDEPFPDDVVLILSTMLGDDPDTPDVNETQMSLTGGLQSRVFDSQLQSYNPDSRLATRVEIMSYKDLFIHNPRSQKLTVEYRAGLPPLSLSYNPDAEIDISPVFETALQLHVASQIFTAMGGADFGSKANALMQLFETEIILAKSEDLGAETRSTPDGFDRLRDKGFI